MAEKKKTRITNEDIENSPILKAAAENFFQFVDIVKGAEPFANEELSKIIYEKGTITQVVRYRDILDSFPVSFHFLLSLLETYNTNDKAGISQAIKNHIIEEYGEEDTELETILAAIYRAIINYNNEKTSDASDLDPSNTPQIIAKKLQEISYPLDKVSSNVWDIPIGKKTKLKAERDIDSLHGKKANIYVILNFEDMKGTGVTISRPLTSYDKRVFIAASNLKVQGHNTVTAAQIYEAMGNKGRPSAAQRQKIMKSIEAMSVCRVSLDNTEEAQLYTKYEKVKRQFNLLSTVIDEAYTKGLVVKDAITITEIPRLFIFAKNRGQIATTPIKLLESPISQTEDNLTLEDYLLRRILKIKNTTNQSPTILLDTVYKNCNINTSKKRSRAIEKIERLLSHWKKEAFIKSYNIMPEKIEVKT